MWSLLDAVSWRANIVECLTTLLITHSAVPPATADTRQQNGRQMANRKTGTGGGREIGYEIQAAGRPGADEGHARGRGRAGIRRVGGSGCQADGGIPERRGPAALRSKRERGRAPSASRTSVIRDHVVALKREHEPWGTRRIRDVLARFEALGVSEQEVRKILHAEDPHRDAVARTGTRARTAPLRAR